MDAQDDDMKGGYNMLNVIENVNVCGIIRHIREEIWNYDIPSPTVPEYVEHHEQMQKLLKICDDALDQIDQLAFWVDESEVQ